VNMDNGALRTEGAHFLSTFIATMAPWKLRQRSEPVLSVLALTHTPSKYTSTR